MSHGCGRQTLNDKINMNTEKNDGNGKEQQTLAPAGLLGTRFSAFGVLKEYPKTGMFQNAPLPWRYDAKTRNVIALDGSIVCRNGDTVYGYPEVGEGIANIANWIGAQVATTVPNC